MEGETDLQEYHGQGETCIIVSYLSPIFEKAIFSNETHLSKLKGLLSLLWMAKSKVQIHLPQRPGHQRGLSQILKYNLIQNLGEKNATYSLGYHDPYPQLQEFQDISLNKQS